MKRQYFIAISLAIIFSVLLISQYLLTVDARYDKQIENDLYQIESAMQVTLGQEAKSYTTSPNIAKVVPKPSIAELDLNPAVDKRAITRNYELDYLNEANQAAYSRRIKFELCAVFKTDTKTGRYNFDTAYDEFRFHSAGRDCFVRYINV